MVVLSNGTIHIPSHSRHARFPLPSYGNASNSSAFGIRGRSSMAFVRLIGMLAVVSALCAAAPIAAAQDGKYPDWSGAWARFVVPGLGGQPSHDQTKPWGPGQQAPLTEEDRKVL